MKNHTLTSPLYIPLTVLLTVALTVSAGCAGAQTPSAKSVQKGTLELIECTDPRPEMCTMDYRPVCGKLGDGTYSEYSNACVSCSDPEVIGYRDGNCGSN